MRRHELTEVQCLEVSSLIGCGRGRRSVRGDRNFVNAVVWVNKVGAPWRDLPEHFGSWKTIFNRFSQWAHKGKWEAIFKSLAVSDDAFGSLMDGTVVRAHQDSCGGRGGPKKNGIGRSRGGVSTKVHAVTDSRGLPLHLEITPGQRHDIVMAEQLLKHAQGEFCLADTAYDSNSFIDAIESRGMIPVIPNKPNRKEPRLLDLEKYGVRYKVECFFHSLKRFRRIATRYEKTSRNYMAFLHLAAAMLWLAA